MLFFYTTPYYYCKIIQKCINTKQPIRFPAVGLATNISNASKDQRKYYNRRKVDSFDHKPTCLVVIHQRDGILHQIWNDSGIRGKSFVLRQSISADHIGGIRMPFEI